MDNKNSEQISYSYLALMLDYFSRFRTSVAVRHASYSSYYIQQPHIHDFPQIWYCRKGSYIHSAGSNVYDCHAGSFIIIPPGVPHGFEITGDEEVVLSCIDLTYYFIKGDSDTRFENVAAFLFLHEMGSELKMNFPYKFDFSDEDQARVEKLFDKLLSVDYSEPFNIKVVKDAIYSIFALAPFSLSFVQKKRVALYVDKKFNGIMEAIRYINMNFSEKLSCDDMLKIACVCRTEFFRLIKKATGQTFSIYVQHVRISRVKRLIALTNFSFQYIADVCGFPNVPYMSRVYKKVYRMTLRQARSYYPENRELYPKLLLSHNWLEDYRAFSCG